jgi:hypothetical protein
MRIRFSFILVASSTLLGAGCGAINGTGRSLGQGVIGGLQQYATQQPTSDSLRAMFDSVAAFAGSAIQAHLQPALDSTMRMALDRAELSMGRAEDMVNRLEDTTIARLNGPLNTALDELIRTNARSLGESGREQVNTMLRELRVSIETEFAPMIRTTVAGVVDTMTIRLASSLEGDMLRALTHAADSIAEVAARAAVRGGNKEIESNPIVRNIKRAAPFVVIGILALSLGWYWYTRRRTEKALEAVATAIRDTGDTDLKSDVKTEALRRNVEPWLNDFLRKKGFLKVT